nr:hypothetical protein CTI12_AA123990 [Tanacetum cinerariifolium]
MDKTIIALGLYFQNKAFNLAKAFRMARNWCHLHGSINVQIKILGERTKARQYNKPTVAALITNDFGDGVLTKDVIMDSKDSGPKRISELHPSYMALQYPLLFPYGKDGFHEKIPYHTNEGSWKNNCGFVTMKEYYAYIIQQRNDQGTTLLRGGRLFQQYLVDAFTAVEKQRLKWSRNNQDTLLADLYHNVCDTVTRGDTNVEGLGKRIVLVGTFIGGPRYRMSNYQDAMALCRTYETLDLFLTFTSNLKWLEIAEMLSYLPGQKPHDQPEVGTRVFKLKLTQLLEDLTKIKIFDECRRDFPDLPKPNPKLVTNMDNSLIREALAFDTNKREIGKTFLYKTIMKRLWLERMILLAVASSDAINAYMFKKLAGDTVTYNSVGEICKASTDTLDQHNLYPVEFLNSLNFPGMPPHSLCLKKELFIMLIRNVKPSKGL